MKYVLKERRILYIDGAAIRRDREARGISVREAARKVGIGSSHFSRLENGNAPSTSPETLSKIIVVLAQGKIPADIEL